VKTWRDASVWAWYADDAGLDCPVCEKTITYELTTLGLLVDAVQDHIAKEHVPTIDGAIFSDDPTPGTPRPVSLSPRADPDRFSRIQHDPSPSQQVTPSEIQIGTADIGGHAK
jgi:hypothetical protein